MASSSGNSATSSQIQNSGSEGDLQQLGSTVVDERKRKRMQSNRESARRSRMRKQKHLDDLMAQVTQLKRENHQILDTISLTTQQYLSIEADNSVLRAQMGELGQRLQSLNEIINYMNTLSGVGTNSLEDDSFGGYFGNYGHGLVGDFGIHDNINVDPWTTLGYLNQPIMASADVLQC